MPGMNPRMPMARKTPPTACAAVCSGVFPSHLLRSVPASTAVSLSVFAGDGTFGAQPAGQRPPGDTRRHLTETGAPALPMTRGTSLAPSRSDGGRSAVAPCSPVVVSAFAWLTPDRCTPSRLNFEAHEGLSLVSADWIAISPFGDTGEPTGRPPVASGTYPREPTRTRSPKVPLL